MPHRPGHDPTNVERALQGATVSPDERTPLQRFGDEFSRFTEGNPIAEALGAIGEAGSESGLLGVLMPSPAGAVGGAGGMAARGSRVASSSSRPMETILQNPEFRRRVFRDVGTEGAKRVRKYIGAGRAPDEALGLAKKELRAKRLHDALEVFEQTGRVLFGGLGRGRPSTPDVLSNVGHQLGAANISIIDRGEEVNEELDDIEDALRDVF